MDTLEEVNHVTVITPLLILLLISLLIRRQYRQPDYSHIPTVGPSRFPFYFIGAFQFLFNARGQLEKGYKRHGHAPFKVADFRRWHVVVSGPRLLEELKNAPEDEIAFVDAHTCPGLSTSREYAAELSTKLTRNLPVVFPEIREELLAALADVIPSAPLVHSGAPDVQDAVGWTSVPVADTLVEVVSRVCSRAILGPQLCRTADLTALSKAYIRSTATRSAMRAVLPEGLFSYVTSLFFGVSWRARRLRKSLERIIRQWQEKPPKRPQEDSRDLLSSLLSSPSPRDTSTALLALTLQAVPSCTLTLTDALYRLAACDELAIRAMRGEVEGAVRGEGWTLRALERMGSVDAFMREGLRAGGLRALTMRRTTLTPHTLADGTPLPPGTSLSALCIPPPPSLVSAPASDALEGPRYALTTASPTFLAWGLGHGACPGRFVAGAVIKLVLAQVVLGFDVRFPAGGAFLEGRWCGLEGVPDLRGRVEVRRRWRV
ncbi:hypothetical protein DXG01_011879 [Tephrocybe rancida]|nr:hypothetical protein DXG01_011879 [Tephrocybe rancida]